MDSVSDGRSRNVASEFGRSHAPVSVGYKLHFSRLTPVLFGLPLGVTVFFALYISRRCNLSVSSEHKHLQF